MADRPVTTILALLCLASCDAREESPPADEAAVRPSYGEDVHPILAAHCLECHSTGGVTVAVELDSYEGARAAGRRLPHVLVSGEMPPWGLSAQCGTWAESRALRPDEIATILSWLDLGMPEGRHVASMSKSHGPTAARADRRLAIGAGYEPQPGAGVVRCFVVDPQLAGDDRLTAMTLETPSPLGIQQISLYALDTEEAESAARSLDAEDLAPGYPCYGSPRTPGSRFVLGTTRGDATMRLPSQTGVRLGAGRPLVAEVQYDILVRSTPPPLALVLELDPEAEEGEWVDVRAPSFVLPGSSRGIEVTARYVPAEPLTVHAVYPRMKLFGKGMRVTLHRPRGGGRACMLDQVLWDFHALRAPRAYTTPLSVEAGSLVEASCTFDTVGSTADVGVGEAMLDEECAVSLFTTR